MKISTKKCFGSELTPYRDDLARLRMTVFREWPYLYEGTYEYEKNYLAAYLQNSDSLSYLVFDDDQLVGATTAIPGEASDEAFRGPLEKHDLNPSDLLYLGESLLLPKYRGLGMGHRYFDIREEHARKLGLKKTYFCSVIREHNHPLKPKNARELTPFWKQRGYLPLEDAVVYYQWLDRGQKKEDKKGLQVWLRKASL